MTGGPDIYCYACNESRIDPELVLHLSNFGINIQTQKKTEKTMTELVRLCLSSRTTGQRLSPNNCDQQIEHNLNFDFSLTDEAGHAFEPVFGPSLTGLQNLGNRCISSLVPLSRTRLNSTCQQQLLHVIRDSGPLFPPALSTTLRYLSRSPTLDRLH